MLQSSFPTAAHHQQQQQQQLHQQRQQSQQQSGGGAQLPQQTVSMATTDQQAIDMLGLNSDIKSAIKTVRSKIISSFLHLKQNSILHLMALPFYW